MSLADCDVLTLFVPVFPRRTRLASRSPRSDVSVTAPRVVSPRAHVDPANPATQDLHPEHRPDQFAALHSIEPEQRLVVVRIRVGAEERPAISTEPI